MNYFAAISIPMGMIGMLVGVSITKDAFGAVVGLGVGLVLGILIGLYGLKDPKTEWGKNMDYPYQKIAIWIGSTWLGASLGFLFTVCATGVTVGTILGVLFGGLLTEVLIPLAQRRQAKQETISEELNTIIEAVTFHIDNPIKTEPKPAPRVKPIVLYSEAACACLGAMEYAVMLLQYNDPAETAKAVEYLERYQATARAKCREAEEIIRAQASSYDEV